MSNENFYKNFWSLCNSIGVTKQLQDKGYLVDNNTLSAKGAEVLMKVGYSENPDWVEEYRMKFKSSNIGITGKLSDPISVAGKMNRFLLMYPSYTKETILRATDMYIEENIRTPKYIQEAGYFIFKRDGHKSEETSRLAAYCEQVLERIEFDSIFTDG